MLVRFSYLRQFDSDGDVLHLEHVVVIQVPLFQTEPTSEFLCGYTRYPEWDVVSSHCLHPLEELNLESNTNCFVSVYNLPFERTSLWKIFAMYTPNTVHAQLLFRLPWAG